MLAKRIIPCLDVKDGRVVKGVNFFGLRDAGCPIELAEKYYLEGADELCFLDITASLEGRKAFGEIISRTAERVFVPLCVGGGVSEEADVGALLRAGADKVAINSGAIKNPELIAHSAKQYGSQCIVAAIDAKISQNTYSGWEVYGKGGRVPTGLDAISWAKQVVALGAGEILLTSMDADGTKNGYDLRLTSRVASEVSVPVIASGGAGKLEHILAALEEGQADAALLASLLHYGELTIAEIKAALAEHSIPVRSIR